MGAGIVCIIVAIFALFVAGAFKKVPNQVKTEGVIHSIEYAGNSHDPLDNTNRNMYYYYIQYIVNGKEYLLKTKMTNSKSNVVGKKRIVKYNKNNPEQAIASPDKGIYVFVCIFLIFGIYAICSSL